MSATHVVCRDCVDLEGLAESEAFAESAVEAHLAKYPDHTVATGVITP